MSENIIDEVMELVRLHGAAWFSSGIANESRPSEAARSELKAQHEFEAIRAKLREVLERKPMQEGEIFNWWRGENGLEDHDMCKLQDFSEVVRAVEKRHNIK